jgi:ABC-2 type transport system permease protein
LAGLGAGMLFVDLDVPAGRIAAAIASMLPLTLLFLGLSLWASAALPTRGMAAMLVTGVVIVTYFLNLVGSSVTALDDLRRFSPFYWADFSRVLLYGVDWLRSGAMLALAALFLGLALWSFERRDLSAGGQEWSLPSRLPFRRKARVVVAGNLRRPEAETA